ncbi:MAG: aspartate aminotransferase family protein [Gammaproteobacteria bacterium]|nr:aspartate aminotransferase family protein [Gammaproteobacteria bacterium]MCH9764269.1 aspartate aminotransferase family protein [Gammaproteobacteria bacterium]
MALTTNYSPLPVAFTHGKGIWLYDEAGNAYLDGLSGIAVCGLGHAHPDVTHTIQTQAAKLLHTSNAYHILEQEALADKITALTGMPEMFFCNSGSEANETAIKLIRLYGHAKGIDTPSTIVMKGAFHGRSLATLTATGGRKHQAGFEPLVPGFVRAPYNNIEAIQTIAANRSDVVAVMLEPIQGEGGLIVGDEAYLHAVSALCKANDWLLVVDEVQTGNGRTGALFASLGMGIEPDILTTAKGLGNGVPIGACLIGPRASGLFKPGSHGSTFGGNPLACAIANTVLDVIVRDKLCARAAVLGVKLKQAFMEKIGDHPHVRGIRGKGLMLGIELDRPAADMRLIGLEERLLFNVTAETVVRFLPPLIMSDDELDELIFRFFRVFERFFSL